MATVFRAVDTEVGEGAEAMRAIKVLRGKWAGRKKTRQRLENEAAVMMGLPHPNVVQVHGLYSSDTEVFIIMELLPGGSAWDLVMAHGKLPARVSVDMCLEVLEALALAHDNGIIHRDIKPHNVLLTVDGHAKVTDFGIARVEDSGLTRTGVVMGTLAYMPPEQKLSARKVDARADLYAVGAMLWACLTGREPHDLYAAGMDDALADEYFAEVPDGLVPVVLQATRFAPEARHADARAMQQALTEARATLPPSDQTLADLIDVERAHKLQDAAATVLSDETEPRARSTYPEESAALTPILPPRRDEGQPIVQAQLPATTTANTDSNTLAKGLGVAALGLMAALGLGLIGIAGLGWFWLSAAAEPPRAVAIPSDPVPAPVPATPAPAAPAPPAPTAATEPEPTHDAVAVAPEPALEPVPAHVPVPAPTPAPASEPAPAPEPAPVPAPEIRVVEVPAPTVRVVEAPTPAPAPAPAPSPAPAVAPAPVPAPAPPPVAAGGWEATSLPGNGGRVTVVLTLKADRDVTTSSGDRGRPKLVLVCDRKSRAYFDPGVATNMVLSETGMDASYAQVAINGDVQKLYLDQTGAQTALGLSRKWIDKMRGGGRWTVDFVPSGAEPTRVGFALSGLDALMTERFDPHCKR